MVVGKRNISYIFATTSAETIAKLFRFLHPTAHHYPKLTLVVVDSPSFRSEEFLHKMAISSKNYRVKEQNHSFLTDWTYWMFSSDYLLWLLDNIAWPSVHPCLFSTVSLRPLVGLRPPSKIPSFSHSASLRLTMPAASASVLYKIQLQESVLSSCGCSLSLWHSPPQQAYGIVRVPQK